jgi:hypothetical protein
MTVITKFFFEDNVDAGNSYYYSGPENVFTTTATNLIFGRTYQGWIRTSTIYGQ